MATGNPPGKDDPAVPGEDEAVGEILAAFIVEAMTNGWMIFGGTNAAVPEHLRDLFPGHVGLGLTPEGQQRLAAVLTAAGVANVDRVVAGFDSAVVDSGS